jgi:hypothetical protein
MMKKKIILILLVIGIIGGYFGYNYVMAPPKNISESKADLTLNTKDFYAEFTSNAVNAEKKYAEKVILIEGTITEVEDEGPTLNKTVFCKFEDKTEFKVGDKIKVKGLFIGYDDLFEVIKLDQCSIVN